MWLVYSIVQFLCYCAFCSVQVILVYCKLYKFFLAFLKQQLQTENSLVVCQLCVLYHSFSNTTTKLQIWRLIWKCASRVEAPVNHEVRAPTSPLSQFSIDEETTVWCIQSWACTFYLFCCLYQDDKAKRLGENIEMLGKSMLLTKD